jgi:hypothetical protein
VAEVGGQVRQSGLGIDAFSVPFFHAIADHCMAQIVDSRTDPAAERFQAGPSQGCREEIADSAARVTSTARFSPEHPTHRLDRPTQLPAYLKVTLQDQADARGKRQVP